jgi:hypothetical protein
VQTEWYTIIHLAEKPQNGPRNLCSLPQMATLNSSTFFKKYNTDQNEMGNAYAFKDFILDGVRKMTANGKSLTTASTQLRHKQHPATCLF